MPPHLLPIFQQIMTLLLEELDLYLRYEPDGQAYENLDRAYTTLTEHPQWQALLDFTSGSPS
jgi:hypothetical protein